MHPGPLPLCCLLLAIAPAPAMAEEGFAPMFDGKTLDGWKKVGGSASYKVEGDQVIGTVDPASKANTFLRTEKTYGDFILKFDLKLDVPGNSGVQFRSHQRESKDGNGRVFGYQCEVDPSKRAWTGGLYHEAGRNWLYPLDGHPEAQKAFKLADWNSFTIEARGPILKTTVNGVTCTDTLDAGELEGFIALQVHTGKEGLIRWRDVQIKDLGMSKWTPLFDGKSLDGWAPAGAGKWTVEGGEIHGVQSKTDPKAGQLFTAMTADDFAIKLKFKLAKGNSGLHFRAEEGGPTGVKGFQADIDSGGHLGGLHEAEGRGWVSTPKPEDAKKWYKPDAWNELSVVAVGGRVIVHVNGFKSAELKDDPGRSRGKFALQMHAAQDVDVRFKDIEYLAVPAIGK